MAAKHLSLLLLTLLSLSHIHARDVQMFNKIPSKINENVVLKETNAIPNKQEQENPLNTNDQQQQQQQPNFIPENENSYGLYGHESGQLPPSTTTPNTIPTTTNPTTKEVLPKYLPKNYNPVAYVTEPEDFSGSSSFMDKSYTTTDNKNNGENNYYNNGENNYNNNKNGENNFYNNGENNYYNGMKDSEFMNKEFTTTDDNNNINNYYNNGGNNGENNNYINVQQKGMSDTRFMDTAYTTTTTTTPNNNNNDNYYSGERVNRFQQQGMSDTRFLHNGRYFYDVNAEKYSRGPYENSQEIGLNNNQQFNTKGYYGNVENSSYQNNNFNDGQDEQYQDEEDMP